MDWNEVITGVDVIVVSGGPRTITLRKTGKHMLRRLHRAKECVYDGQRLTEAGIDLYDSLVAQPGAAEIIEEDERNCTKYDIDDQLETAAERAAEHDQNEG